MSFLAPFYLLGALSVLAPIVFHLIRRQPKGAIPVSSLMFLRPTPPRLTRRSRLDDWPLLILRGLILLLIAAAFARPFLNESATTMEAGVNRRVVVLIDTSASMRREEIWTDAKTVAIDAIHQLASNDAIAVFSFDRKIQLRFATSLDGAAESAPTDRDTELAVEAINELNPTWHATDFAAALKDVAQWTQSWGDDSSSGAEASPVHIVLVSDMQTGKGIESLQAYPWPDNVSVSVERLEPISEGNASAVVMAGVGQDGRIPIRVTRDASGTTSPISIRWQSESLEPDESQWRTIDLSSGQTQTIQLELPEAKTARLTLRGDEQSFDNTRHFLTPEPLKLDLVYLGGSADERSNDAEFFLRKVPFDDDGRRVEVTSWTAETIDEELDPAVCPLVIVVDPTEVSDRSRTDRLKSYVQSGGTCLLVLGNPMEGRKAAGDKDQWNDLLEMQIDEASVSDYAMISYVDFRDPVFEPFALPQFSDFTKIRFWSYRRLSLMPDSWKTVVSFDGGDPLLLKKRLGNGHIWLMTAGWQPSASQFALSSKFVPMMTQLFESGIASRPIASAVTVGDTIEGLSNPKAALTRLDEQLNPIGPIDPESGITEPGYYRLTEDDRSFDFVANLDESESRVAVVDEERLEQLGVPLKTQISRTVQVDYERQLRHRELENRQRWWQILLLVALVLIAVETLWGSRRARQIA
ncbi:BatA domain-containing protein [Neorhodopirellula pilleata]|uniref:VWFA domain-containing protein n=1 Tax=Neorhodopirellula pilleata TaxID=2714738 RepID=A0A5C6A4G9_9BACT|nr:BatA domain-containing protein [Neorhodopirellula pilleata]TWT94270.1 hypothetical protein Pla100_38800 [Neorhodopirellula pilleata]